MGTTLSRAVTAVAASALAVLLAGCGAGGVGGSDDDGFEEQALKLAKCLRQQGLDVADPVNGAPAPLKDVDPRKMDEAMQACRKYQPPRTGDGGDGQQDVERALKMAECLRENGVEDWPDPQADGGFSPVPEAMDDPDREAAEKKCTAELHGPEGQ